MEHHGEWPSDINKQSLIVSGKLPLDKTHSFLSNVLLDNNNKSDMVEAIAYVLFSMH